MATLPSELSNRCLQVLSRCQQFESHQTLTAVFITPELNPFRAGLPQAGNTLQRVEGVLDYLLSHYLPDQRPAFIPFLITLRDRYPPGDALLDDLDELLDAVSQALNVSTDSATGKPNLTAYLQQVVHQFERLPFRIGYVSEPLRLEDVYLELPVVKPTTQESLFSPRQRVSGTTLQTADEMLQQSQASALVGFLGMGKTTSLQYLAWAYACSPPACFYWRLGELVPFNASMRDLATYWTETERKRGPDGFADALAASVASRLDGTLGAQLVKRVISDSLRTGTALVLLDALDEFHASENDRGDFIQTLQSVWATDPFRQNFIILTSRPYRFLNPYGFSLYTLRTFEKESVQSLVSRLGRALLKARTTVSSDAANAWMQEVSQAIRAPHLREFWSPFYVTLMVYLGTSGESVESGMALLANIQRLTDLYSIFLRETVGWEKGKGNPPNCDERDLKQVLAYTAYYTFVEPTKRDWLDQAVGNAARLSIDEVRQVLNFWLNTGVLNETRERSAIYFQHSGFQAYGVAYALAAMWHSGQRDRVNELNRSYLATPEWELIWQLFEGLR